MNVALASLDKWAGHDKGDVNHSNKYCYANNGWHHIRQAVQLAEQAIVHETLVGTKMPIMADMMHTIVTIGRGGGSLRLRMVVEGDGEHHWQIHQHQQPCKPLSSIVEIAHYPKTLFLL